MDEFGEFGELINSLTQNARASLVSADLWSQITHSSYIGTEHLLMGILAQSEAVATQFLADEDVNLDKIREIIGIESGKPNSDLSAVKVLSESARLSLSMGWSIAREYKQNFLGTEHILYAILEQKNSQAYTLLTRLKVDINNLSNRLKQYFDRQLLELSKSQVDGQNLVAKQKRIAQNLLINRYGNNLTRAAAEGLLDPVVGREAEIERLVTILSRRTKSNPVLIGEPGVGKSAIVEGLAQRINAGQVPRNLINHQIVELDLTGILAGTKFRGEFEDRLRKITEELRGHRQIIAFIDELHLLVGAGSSEGSIDAANILKPALARGQIRLIGATTFDDYRKYIEKDAALERRFQTVDVPEPSRDQAVAMLKGISEKYAKHHRVRLTSEVIEAAVDLSIRYISERFLPDKAIDLLDEAAAMAGLSRNKITVTEQKKIGRLNRVRLELDRAIESEDYNRAAELKIKYDQLLRKIHATGVSQTKVVELTVADIAKAISLRSGVPVHQVSINQRARLSELEKVLSRRVVGQNEAIEVLANSLKRSRSGVSAGNRPIGSFIFMGPSGVGKTELAKVLAEEMFGGKDALLKIDMSEFSESHSLSRLLGAPAGYVGYDDGTKLTDEVRRRPYRVVLFDEIEKANQDVFNILLQILEDGRLSDAKGRSVDFTNTVIILTSNLGSELLAKQSKFGFGEGGKTDNEEIVRQALSKFMRPELINRFDRIVVFGELKRDSLMKIVTLMLTELRQRLRHLGYSLTVDTRAKRHLVDLALAENSGARPLRRLIEEQFEQPIAAAIVAQKATVGDSLHLDLKNQKIKLTSYNSETAHAKS